VHQCPRFFLFLCVGKEKWVPEAPSPSLSFYRVTFPLIAKCEDLPPRRGTRYRLTYFPHPPLPMLCIPFFLSLTFSSNCIHPALSIVPSFFSAACPLFFFDNFISFLDPEDAGLSSELGLVPFPPNLPLFPLLSSFPLWSSGTPHKLLVFFSRFSSRSLGGPFSPPLLRRAKSFLHTNQPPPPPPPPQHPQTPPHTCKILRPFVG